MDDREPEPIERLEEILSHPADKTFAALHLKSSETKKELAEERHELGLLLNRLPNTPPVAGTREHAAYLQIQAKIQILKEKVSKKHNDLMEILKTEEKISREIQDKKTP